MRDRPQIPDYYAVLGIGFDASQDELRKAWRTAQKQWHPDRNPTPEAAEKIRQINAAWEVLGDPERRAEYDSAYFSIRARIAEEQRRAREAERLERERRERLRQQELERKMRAEAEARRRAQEAEDRRKAEERRRKADEQRERKRRERALAAKRAEAVAEARRRAAEEDKRDRERRRREEKRDGTKPGGGYRPPGRPVGANARGRGGWVWGIAAAAVIAIVATIAALLVAGSRTTMEDERVFVVKPGATLGSSGDLIADTSNGFIDCPHFSSEPSFVSESTTYGGVEFDFVAPDTPNWSIGLLYHTAENANTATFVYVSDDGIWSDHWTRVRGRDVDSIEPIRVPVPYKAGATYRMAVRTSRAGSTLDVHEIRMLDIPASELHSEMGPMRLCVDLLPVDTADYTIRYNVLRSWTE